MKSKQLKEEICKILSSKKASDIVALNVSEKTIIADYYVIASGNSSTHVKSLCDNLEETMEKAGERALRREGVREGRWAVLDYGSVIVHIFNDETRLFYHLEKLWDDGVKAEKFDD